MKQTIQNTIPFPAQTKPAKVSGHLQRFRIVPFINRARSKSWRVTGWKRDGTRIRENFTHEAGAKCRHLELETEYLTGHRETTAQATRLSTDQIRIAEAAFLRLGADADLPLAVEHWLAHGKQLSVKESPRLDDALIAYKAWLPKSGLRILTQHNQRQRAVAFANKVGNLRICDFTHEVIEDYLTKRDVSPTTQDNCRRALSGFFSWCIQRPRRWIAHNPCKEIRIQQGERKPPAVLTVTQCEALLKGVEKFKAGRMAPFVAVCLFGGLRPFEAARLTAGNVNLADKEIRLEGWQTKTGIPRVVEINATLAAWLEAYKDTPFYGMGWKKDLRTVKKCIGFGTATKAQPHLVKWVNDVLRHTAISHYLRNNPKTYVTAARQFGNSEAIITKHYESRVSSDDSKKFYALMPSAH